MTDTLKLKAKIVAAGLTQEALAQMLGINHASMNYKINNRREFRVSEIRKLREVLSISAEEAEEIFFAEGVE